VAGRSGIPRGQSSGVESLAAALDSAARSSLPADGALGSRQGDDRGDAARGGKGGKTRLVPVTAEMLAELMSYRRAQGLSPLPTTAEQTQTRHPAGEIARCKAEIRLGHRNQRVEDRDVLQQSFRRGDGAGVKHVAVPAAQ
jgi:hypothetical protein